MKITFLGTGAIGYPFAFCNCENCTNARKYKGKSLRKKSSILINDDLIIDLTTDTQIAMTMYDKNLGKIKYLLQTHSHHDHFDPNLLTSRLTYITDKKQKLLEIIAHKKCLEVMNKKIYNEEKTGLLTEVEQQKLLVKITPINEGEERTIGNYKVKAIQSNHDENEGSLLYLVKSENKIIFYATDTSILTEKSLKTLEKEKLDIVIMDHNFGNVSYYNSHLNEKLFIEQINKLKELNIINEKTLIYGTHISHEGNPYHEIAEKKAISNGYHIAYDGLEINL